MTKQEVLSSISVLALKNEISKEELIAALEASGNTKRNTEFTKKIGITEILYYIGGAIVFLGISILIFQNWSTLSFPIKIISTLGSGIAAYFVGLLFSRDTRTISVSPAFYLISSLVTPIGLYVVFNNAGFDLGSASIQTLVSGILLVWFVTSYAVLKRYIFIIFSIAYGTWFFFSMTGMIAGTNPSIATLDFMEYRVLITGLVYLLLGHYFSQDVRRVLSGALYGFGILFFLGASLALGGWQPNQNGIWELLFPGLDFAALFLSVYLKSKAFLTFGTLFLMVYILKITSEYFSSGLGWPLTLVITGFLLIGVGFISLSLKKKYAI